VSKATAIVNARVFDGTRLRDWTSVRFADGIITDCATSSTARDGDEVIDAEGGTILPGLMTRTSTWYPALWRRGSPSV
jgi:imidazolonepropionase-like amidohydrolase